MGNIENRSSLFYFESYEKCMKDVVEVEKKNEVEQTTIRMRKFLLLFCLLKV
jgi:hypothetical protein